MKANRVEPIMVLRHSVGKIGTCVRIHTGTNERGTCVAPSKTGI